MTSFAYPDLTNATYGYDALSRLVSAANQNGTVTFGYDSRGRVRTTTDVWGKTLGYSYDANGNRTALTVGGAAYGSYQYDVVNRLTNLADSAGQNFVYDDPCRIQLENDYSVCRKLSNPAARAKILGQRK